MRTSFARALLLALIGSVPMTVVAQDGAASGTAGQADGSPEVSLEQVQDTNMLVSLAQQAERSEDWQAAARIWARLSALRPQRGDYLYNAAAMYALLDQKTHAYDALLKLQVRGFAFRLADDPRLKNVQGTEIWDYLVTLNNGALEAPFGEGSVAFELPASDLLLDSMTYDPLAKTFLFGSARDGKVYRRKADGSLDAWTEPDPEHGGAVTALAVDARNNALWVATAGIPHFQGFRAAQAGKAGLVKYDLRNGRRLAAFAFPDDRLPHVPAVMAVAGNGQLFIGEGLRGQLFQFDGERIKPLLAEPKLGGIRGLTLSADGKTLYFADVDQGVFGLNLVRNSAFDVKLPNNVVLAGIEGLYPYENQLVAVQSGMMPRRVMRLELAEDGMSITQGTPIEANNPAFEAPTWGVVQGDDLYFIANSQRKHYDGYGLPKAGAGQEPLKVFRTPIRFNWDFEPPKMPEGVRERLLGKPPTG